MPAPPLPCPEGGRVAAAERALVARLPAVLGVLRARAVVVLPADGPVAAGRVLEAGGMVVAAGSGGGGGTGTGAGVAAVVVAEEEGVMAADVASPGLTAASPAAALEAAAPGVREAPAGTLALAEEEEEERGVRLAMAGRERGVSGKRRSGKERGNSPLPGTSRRAPRNR
jgi:hypothetical protein